MADLTSFARAGNARGIRLRPGAGSPRYAHALDLPGLRFRRCGRFPFLDFYMEYEDRIDIWRVLHAHRDISASLDQERGGPK